MNSTRLDDRRRIVAGATTIGKRSENAPPDWWTACWYSICTTMVSPGPMLATWLVKMFGPLLLEKSRLLTFGLCLLVDLARFLTRLDLALDEALADLHLQHVDGGILRQRKDVGALDPALAGILETLRDLDARDGAGDVHLHIGLQARCLDEEAGLLGGKEEGAAVDVVRPHEAGELLDLLLAFFGVNRRDEPERHKNRRGESHECNQQ